jgi:FkbH-like protein/FkbM family methyltransferase
MSSNQPHFDSSEIPKASTEPAFVKEKLITFTKDSPEGTFAEFAVGVRSLPYLADHGFQDMIVLPGSLYIEMASCVHFDLLKRGGATIRNARFQNSVILSEDETTIRVVVGERGDGSVEYTFYEVVGDNAARETRKQSCAVIDIDGSYPALGESQFNGFSIKDFTEQSAAVSQRAEFYAALRTNGNQYGPRFQNLEAVWRSGDSVLGKLAVPRKSGRAGRHCLPATVVDSIVQLLAAFIIDQGRTFILGSIDRIEIHDSNLPETLWAHGTLVTKPKKLEAGLIGDLGVFDQTGKLYVTISGVAFTYLDRLEAAASESGSTSICIASTFTAEPLEDSLRFWSQYWGIPTDIKFAPYNQIFQELLSAGSAFRKNRSGVNVVLLRLEDWTEGSQRSGLAGKDRVDECFKNHSRCVLPNGLEIAHLNEYETNYVYKEIFEDQCYLRHGIQLRDGDTVVDIGANIGLFSLFVLDRCPRAKIYAYEPSPIVYELLKANCAAYGPNVLAFNRGVSDRAKSALFTFYEKSSVFSSFHGDEREDKEAIQAVVRNILRNQTSAPNESLEEYVDELTADRLRQTTCECRLTSVSDIIRENRIERIGLLKIDAEKSELEIIRGIEDHHWSIIDQVVVEIHDRTKKVVREIEEMLTQKGYHCAVEEEELLKSSGLFNIYAARGLPIDAETTGHSQRTQAALQRNINEFCAALTSLMERSTVPLVLALCPRTPAARNDPALRKTLDGAESELLERAGALTNVYPIDSGSILRRYPAQDYYDPHSHQLAHIPYTPAGYASIGTTVFRTLASLRTLPYKVVVLDCDNTLWQGVCGEDGPAGIAVTPPHEFLQRFMFAQMQSGALLCLCSKNNEPDVFAVFDQRSDMILNRRHLADWRINWMSKSENLKSLASELNLPLESFIFIDDNPVECADVKANCPGVLTLQLPQESELIPPFLNGVWAFDRPALTEEDQNRTKMYQENAARDRYREQSFTLREFLEGLQLRIDIAEAAENQLSRVSQLTFRTNQFNFTAIRRSESELKNFLKDDNARCLTVRVLDRFGDYGLVGAVVYKPETNHYTVDTFLLSCRVLGKGVEHYLLSELGKKAQREGTGFVEIRFVPSEKNAPAFEFIRSLGVEPKTETTGWLTYKCPTELLARLQYEPDEQATHERPGHSDAAGGKNTGQPRRSVGIFSAAEKIQRSAAELYEVNRIAAAIELSKTNPTRSRVGDREDAASDVEAALLNIWRKVLANPQITVNDNFFEAGGSSLKAVMVIAAMNRELKRGISVVTLFECPTVKLLAAKLGAPAQSRNCIATVGAAERRGQQRRYKKVTFKMGAVG